MDRHTFGLRVRDARRQAALSSDALAELCDCTPVSIRQIESGLRLPSLPKLVSLCNALGVTPDHLLAPELSVPVSGDGCNQDGQLSQLLWKASHLPSGQKELVRGVLETLLGHLEQMR